MSIELEMKQKVAELEDVKADVMRLTTQKLDLARDINAVMADARRRVDEIIAAADAQSQEITEKAKKIRAEADAYAVTTRNSSTELLHIAKRATQEVETGRQELEQARLDFDAYKMASENSIQQKKAEATSLLNETLKLKKETDDQAAGIAARKATLDRQEEGLVAMQKSCKDMQDITDRHIAELQAKQTQCETDNESVKLRIEANQAMLNEIDSKVAYINKETERLQAHADDLIIKKTQNDEQSQQISTKFVQIDKTLKDLEERELAISDKEKLLDIKSADIEKRIKTLKELRAKEK